jgi:hypothetical protein
MGCKTLLLYTYVLLLCMVPFVLKNAVTFHRDGVSEGQSYQVLLHELDAIRKVYFNSAHWFCLLLCLITLFLSGLGLCIAGIKLPTTGYFCRGSETAPYKIIRAQPQ